MVGAVALILIGCAATVTPTRPSLVATAPSTNPFDARAWLALAQIEPVPVLPAAASQPTGPAPLEALRIYAQARAALIDNQRLVAIPLLLKAIEIDPASFELYNCLGRACLGSASSNEQAIAAFEKAATIHGDNLSVQYELGREYLARGDLDKAITHLRLALLTTDYRQNVARDIAAMADFFLAKALQQAGYDRAALERYNSLLKSLQTVGITRGHPELGYLLAHPEIIYAQIGDLYAKHQEIAEARQAYEAAIARDPGNFDLQARLARTLADGGRLHQARDLACSLVLAHHATADTLELLRHICTPSAGPAAFLEALAELHAAHRDDRYVFYALVDAEQAAGDTDKAVRLLAEAVQHPNGDSEMVARLFRLYSVRGDAPAALKLLVETLAGHPDTLRQLSGLWAEFFTSSPRQRQCLDLLQKLVVAPAAEAARQYWIFRIADMWDRQTLAHSALERSASLLPPFAPAYRQLANAYWERPDWDDAQKSEACGKLADRAAAAGAQSLAVELRGMLLFWQKKPAEAAVQLALAVRLGDNSPDTVLMEADALMDSGAMDRAAALLVKLVERDGRCADVNETLFAIYIRQGNGSGAAGVLRAWLDADPASGDARLLQASILAQAADVKTQAAAGPVYLDLLADQPQNTRVLAAAEAYFLLRGHISEFVDTVENQFKKHPDNRQAAAALVRVYAREHRLSEADRVLGALRAAVAADPDQLYYVAHMYEAIDRKEVTEQILQEVVRLDPRHCGACNDLGYTWADAGRNLDRAEALVRVAVDAEPDNQSFLDSLGWVCYKRGRFAEARDYLERAIGSANRPDPVVLDHLGDVLYRLDRQGDAAMVWKRSLGRIGQLDGDRDDLKALKEELEEKLKESGAGQPVKVAPIVSAPAKPSQAKN